MNKLSRMAALGLASAVTLGAVTAQAATATGQIKRYSPSNRTVVLHHRTHHLSPAAASNMNLRKGERVRIEYRNVNGKRQAINIQRLT